MTTKTINDDAATVQHAVWFLQQVKESLNASEKSKLPPFTVLLLLHATSWTPQIVRRYLTNLEWKPINYLLS